MVVSIGRCRGEKGARRLGRGPQDFGHRLLLGLVRSMLGQAPRHKRCTATPYTVITSKPD